VFPWLCTAATKKLEKGETVDFAGIKVDRTGIKQEPYQHATWDQIKERQFLIKEGDFMICREYKQVFLGVNLEGTVVFGPIANIPNFTVLLALIAQRVPLPAHWHKAFLDGLVVASK
jgi:hypothetical protein